MGSTPEEFAELRRLLALKRHEQPPPGYYQSFAGKVVARIEAEGLAQSRSGWARFFSLSAWSPSFAGANTALVAGLAVLGGAAFVVKNRFDRGRQSVGPEVAVQPGVPSVAPRDAERAFPGANPLGSETFLGSLGGGLVSLPAASPVSQFRMERPTVRERVRRDDTFQEVPAGIFEPWNRPYAAAFPTSIVNFVEIPR